MKKDTDSIIRQLKIAIITGEPNKITKWFDKLFDDTMYASVLNENETIYFKFRSVHALMENMPYKNLNLNGKWMFYYNKSSNSFECNGEYYWKVIADKLKIYANAEYDVRMNDIAVLTKGLFDNKFNTDIPKPTFRISPMAEPDYYKYPI